MTTSDINRIIKERDFPYPTQNCELIETHISWVILTDDYVYKIKKPVKYSFLDFSTLETRKIFCLKELRLNQRLTQDMYLDVLPINANHGFLKIGRSHGKIVDYCILMKRMDESLQMDLLLAKNAVQDKQIIELAGVLAHFHHNAEVIPEGDEWDVLSKEFADILFVRPFIEKYISGDHAQLIKEATTFVHLFLEEHQKCIDKRNEKGYVIDGHGDLHCRNILLSDPPVLFDCIEFNDDFRKLDLLSEIAFLCMDLDRFGRQDLSSLFSHHYFNKVHCIENEADKLIFLYYKMFRANVMIKVQCVRAMEQDENSLAFQKTVHLIKDYFQLFRNYFSQLKEAQAVLIRQ